MSAALAVPELAESTTPKTERHSSKDEVVLYGLVVLLMFCPLAFGAVEPWAIFFLEAAAAVLMAIWMARQIKSEEIRVQWNSVFAPMLAFLSIICIQMLPGISAYRHATFSKLLLYIAYGTACFLVTQSLTRTKQLRAIATGLAVYGTSVAMFAILQSLSSADKLYWVRTPRFGGWIYGPYVNHNHYAGLMEMLVPVPLVFAFTRYPHGRERWAAASAAALMGATIFLCGSRGGMIAFCAQVAIFFCFLFKERRREGVVFLLGGFLLLSVGLIAWIGGSQVSARLSTMSIENRSELAGDMRLQIDRDTLRMSAKRPILGWGFGTFENVYPRFRSFYTNHVVDKAHNDYLQWLSETGVVGFFVLLWFLAKVFQQGLRKSRNWRSDVNAGVAVAAILAISGILVHSFLDFNLEIPANALLFYVLCTVAAMDPRFANHHRERRERKAA
jgi:O-antigen ligase